MQKISPKQVTVLSSTLLIPLWAKAIEYTRKDALLKDSEAVRMMNAIDYDFHKLSSAKSSQVGCCARALLLDRIAHQFILQHEDAVIIQLGAGLDARYERLGRPQLTAWYDLDLPEVIALRKQLLAEQGNIYLAMSLFDMAWIDIVKKHQKPILILLEGVLMYFSEQQVKQFFELMTTHLPNAQVAFDSIPKLLKGKAKHHDALGQLDDQPPELKWAIDLPQDLERWHSNIKLLAHFNLSSICRERYNLVLRLLYCTKLGKRYLDMQILHYSV